jgi:hypothetical protein
MERNPTCGHRRIQPDGVSRRSGKRGDALRNAEPLGDLDDDRSGAIRLVAAPLDSGSAHRPVRSS